MNIKSIFGKTVIDKNGNEIGKIEDMDLNTENGSINSILINLKKKFYSNGKYILEFKHVKAIGEYVFIDVEID